MTVTSEGLLLNSKYITMGREEGFFEAFLTQLPLVIVCRELIFPCVIMIIFCSNHLTEGAHSL